MYNVLGLLLYGDFYWAYLIQDIHTHRLYRKAMNYVLGIGWWSKTRGVFREILYTFVYEWVCGQEMQTAFYCHIHSSSAAANPCFVRFS